MFKKQSRRAFFKFLSLGASGVLSAPTLVPSFVFGKQAPSNKIQIGQIGFGRIARSHDLPETMKYDIARVIAVSDVDSKRVADGKSFVEQYYADKKNANYIKVKAFSDYKDMLQDPQIDAVIISTPDHWHAQPAIEAALAGKDIYLQKPASLTIKEGRMMSDIVHRTGRILQIGSQQRSMPQFRIACELVRNGRIGKIHTVRIGLPLDSALAKGPVMTIPMNLDYDHWLGSTEYVYYTEKRVHPQDDYSRPGWLRCEQFGAGMITGWGAHHFDTAHWGLGTEYSGPIEVEAFAEFPEFGLWNVHGAYNVRAVYENDVIVDVKNNYPNGVRFEGDEGWIFVARGNYSATTSDPGDSDGVKPLDASDPEILQSEIKPDEIHLHVSEEQHGDWLKSIQTRKPPVAPAEVGHRSCTACLVSHIAMKLPRILYWDPVHERFKDDDEANSMLSRPQRYPYGTDYILP